MISFQRILSFALGSLGLALLVCSLVAVPNGSLWADGGGGDAGQGPGCTNSGACNVSCTNFPPPCIGNCNPLAPPNGNTCGKCVCTDEHGSRFCEL